MTVHEIAARASVSIGTVDRALNKRGQVIEGVERAAGEIKYKAGKLC